MGVKLTKAIAESCMPLRDDVVVPEIARCDGERASMPAGNEILSSCLLRVRSGHENKENSVRNDIRDKKHCESFARNVRGERVFVCCWSSRSAALSDFIRRRVAITVTHRYTTRFNSAGSVRI